MENFIFAISKSLFVGVRRGVATSWNKFSLRKNP